MKGNIKATPIFCEYCGKELKSNKVWWLELSNTDGKYYTNHIPKDHVSQGAFPFGSRCYKKVRAD